MGYKWGWKLTGKPMCIVKKYYSLRVMGLQSVKGLLKFGAFFKVFISLHKSIDIITQKTILIMKHSSPFKWFLLTVLLSALPLTATAYDFMVDDLAYNVNSDGESVSVTYATVSSGNYSG